MRFISLDFLRFLAAFSVAGPHLALYFSLFEDPVVLETVTSLAVEIFFVLSGFVLCPFLGKIFQSATGIGKNLWVFLVRRWMRTLPLYFLSLVAFIILFSGELDATAAKYSTFLQNFYWPPPMFDYFSVSWSLAVEEWYYVLFPLFLAVFFFCWKTLSGPGSRTSAYLIASITFIVVFTLLRASSDVPIDAWGDGIRRVVLYRIDSIGFGNILYIFRNHIYRIHPVAIFLTAVLTLLYLFSAYNRIYLGHSHPFEFRFLVFVATALFSSAVLSLFLRLESHFQRRLKGLSLWGGRISYGVYLFHIPVAALVGKVLDLAAGYFLALSLLAITVVTTLIYYAFEKPILEARPHFDFSEKDQDRRLKAVDT